MRRRRLLHQDEELLESWLGRIQRRLADGADQPVPAFYGLQRLPLVRGLATLSYSPSCLFIRDMKSVVPVDLAFIVRIWHAPPRSACIIYANYDRQPGVVAVRWNCDDVSITPDDVMRFADRIRTRARDRRIALPAEWQARISECVSEITASGELARNMTLLDEATAAPALKPRTTAGLWIRAMVLGPAGERDRLYRELNGGRPGLNPGELGVLEAASELAASRYFGPEPGDDEIADLATRFCETDQKRSQQQGTRRQLPDQDHVETLFRHAAHDQNVALDEVAQDAAPAVRIRLIIYVLSRLDIADETDRLVRDAEALTFERGLDPPLAQ